MVQSDTFTKKEEEKRTINNNANLILKILSVN